MLAFLRGKIHSTTDITLVTIPAGTIGVVPRTTTLTLSDGRKITCPLVTIPANSIGTVAQVRPARLVSRFGRTRLLAA